MEHLRLTSYSAASKALKRPWAACHKLPETPLFPNADKDLPLSSALMDSTEDWAMLAVPSDACPLGGHSHRDAKPSLEHRKRKVKK